MAASEHEQGTRKPSEQRGGTTPDEAEAHEKGQWAAQADKGVVPAEPDLKDGGAAAREADRDRGSGG